MRQMLQKAISLKPSYTESYELLAFISLVNNENLDEAVLYLRKALQFQPGNQRYAIRIAEIYARQEKYKEASAIAEKIAQTTDEPNVKAQAENVLNQVRQRQEYAAQNEKSRKEYEAAIAEAKKNGDQVIVVNESKNEKTLTDAEIAKIDEEERMRSVNEAIRKPEANEKQVIGKIQKIECKGGKITYTVKSANETLTLSSKDFANLSLVSLLADAENTEVSCGANISAFNTVLTYKTQTDAKSANRGELTAIDFVPDSFRFIDLSKPRPETVAGNTANPPNVSGGNNQNPSVNSGQNASNNNADMETRRREAMMRGIKSAMRQPQAGEKRELGFIEKVECGSKGITFHFKAASQIMKLTSANPQAVQMRAFTPDAAAIQFGCGLKQVDIPVVFTYKENNSQKNSNGELISMEFMPKSFTLEK